MPHSGLTPLIETFDAALLIPRLTGEERVRVEAVVMRHCMNYQ
jgi:hypothetical protein